MQVHVLAAKRDDPAGSAGGKDEHGRGDLQSEIHVFPFPLVGSDAPERSREAYTWPK